MLHLQFIFTHQKKRYEFSCFCLISLFISVSVLQQIVTDINIAKLLAFFVFILIS